VEYNFQNIWQNFIPDSYSANEHFVQQNKFLMHMVHPQSMSHNNHPMFQCWYEECVCAGCEPWANWHCIFLCLRAWLVIPSTWNSYSLFHLSTVKEDNVTGEKTAEFKALKNCNHATSHLYFNKNIKFPS
jgi:hypothetical protein